MAKTPQDRRNDAFQTAGTHYDKVYSKMTPDQQAKADYTQRAAGDIIQDETLSSIDKAVTGMHELQLQTKAVEASTKALNKTFSLTAGLHALQQLNSLLKSAVEGITNIVKEGMRFTVESQMMHQAWYRLNNSIANIFAPAIRGITQIVERLANWFNSWSENMKWTFLAITAMVVGLSLGLSAVVAVLAAVLAISLVIAAVWALINVEMGGIPVVIGLIVSGALAALVVGMIAVIHYTVGWKVILLGIIAVVIELGRAIDGLMTGKGFDFNFGRGYKDAENWFKGGNLTQTSKSTFEDPMGTLQRIQGGIIRQDLQQKIADATGETAQNTRPRGGSSSPFSMPQPVVV